MVYVAISIYGGVLSELEVFIDKDDAENLADEWRKKARPHLDYVGVLEKKLNLDLGNLVAHLFKD